jgi:hypothetical protein
MDKLTRNGRIPVERGSKKRRYDRNVYAWVFAFMLWIPDVSGLESQVEVIVNDSVSQSVLPVTTARAIFGMRLRIWPDGTPIEVFVLYDTNPLHGAFCKQILNIFPHQLRLAWDRLVFSGTGQAPHQVNSEQEMRFRVATTRGAIGYLGEGMINESVRVPRVVR